MKKEKKIVQNNINKEPRTIFAGQRTVRELLIGWRDNGYSDSEVDELLKLFWEWGQKPDSLQLMNFYHLVGITDDSWERLIKKHERVAQMHAYVKSLIGMKREKLMWERDPRSMSETIRLYSKDHRQVYDENLQAKKDISKEQASNINVVVDQIPNSSDVPVKVKE
jgi:hypothetical protein